jgi:starch phosphorylase
MKFMMNGAITIGTLDGANVEIREEAGAENFFLFGLTAEEVARVKASGYRPETCLQASPELAEAMRLIETGHFTRADTEVFRALVENLVRFDPYLVLADYASYVACQAQVSDAWRDAERWTHMSILNTARSGKFSSDRAIREYCDEIWRVPPVTVRIAT